MSNVILGRRGSTNATARELRNALRERGVTARASVNEDERGSYKIIRWGNSDGVRFRARDGLLNSKNAIAQTADKLSSLEIMKVADVSVPEFSHTRADLSTIGFPLIGRTRHHQGGSGLKIINNRFELLRDNESAYWMEKIEIDREYRVHVFGGEVIGVYLKVENEDFEGDINQDIRNLTNGWRFSMRDIPRVRDDIKQTGVESVEALGLDFGAADIVVGTDDVVYVLEVNSAPSLDIEGTIFQTYLDKFEEFFNPLVTPVDEDDSEDEDDELIDEDYERMFDFSSSEDEEQPTPTPAQRQAALERTQPSQADQNARIIELLMSIDAKLSNEDEDNN